MVASFRLDIEGQAATLLSLDRLAGRFEDMHPLMEQFGQYGEDSTRQRFSDQVAPDGERWAPSYRARTQGGETLLDSGRLRASMSYLASSSSAEWGTNVIYAGVHQFGDTIRPKAGGVLKFNIPGLGFRSAHEVVMPQREFLGLSAEDEDELGAIVDDYIAEALS